MMVTATDESNTPIGRSTKSCVLAFFVVVVLVNHLFESQFGVNSYSRARQASQLLETMQADLWEKEQQLLVAELAVNRSLDDLVQKEKQLLARETALRIKEANTADSNKTNKNGNNGNRLRGPNPNGTATSITTLSGSAGNKTTVWESLATRFFADEMLIPTNATIQNQTPKSNMEKLKETLLAAHKDGSPNAVRYYVYDDEDMVREDVRKMCREGHKGTWNKRWGRRFREFAYHEVMLLESLEKNMHMRTRNASQADFFLVPIPIAGMIWMTARDGSETKKAWSTLFEKDLWKKFPEKHVALTEMEPLFGKEHPLGLGYDGDLYSELTKMTIAKDMDMFSWGRIKQVGSLKKSGYNTERGNPDPTRLFHLPRYSFSINFLGSASMPHYRYNPVSFDSFQNKTFNFFYHTKTGTSLFNSTQYRHMPVHVKDSLPQPSSVGWDIPPEQWHREFEDSKFCLVVRGDNPSSRALFRAIRAGCMPVIISEFLPYYAPIFRSQIKMEDYAIMIKEEQFMRDPVATLTQAIDLTPIQLRERVHSLSIAQQLFMTDRPDSLFAEAFAIEAVAAQKEEYYTFPEDLYNSPMHRQ